VTQKPETRGGSETSSYAAAGVDIDRAAETLRRIAPLASATHGPNVLTGLGLFAGFYRLPLGRYTNPVLVASIDGVGTKLALAQTAEAQEGIGYDLLSHCVNDIAVHGADPLLFLDYFAQGRLRPETLVAIIKGIARGCAESGCALVGGETAEMPGVYHGEDFDLAGAIIGAVDEASIIRGADIQVGDAAIALASHGLHTNGFSLARRVLLSSPERRAETAARLGAEPEGVLLASHRMYLAAIRAVRQAVRVKGIAHITGGGLLDNLPRILPPGTAVRIDCGTWSPLPIFTVIEDLGGILREEMFRTFNMGVGLVVILAASHVSTALSALREVGETAWRVGEIVPGAQVVHLA
jgi:phosphoribosylformylglycinamidine cyclo-ligase